MNHTASTSAKTQASAARTFYALALGFVLVVCAVWVTPSHASQPALNGKVIGVSDGDTLTILDDATHRPVRVRLAYIDAPESGQAFGDKAKRALSDICYAKRAEVRTIDVDRHGRLVGLTTCDGVSANDAMVKAGLAWVYAKYAVGQYGLFASERDAKAKKLGLWAQSEPVAPWEFRRIGADRTLTNTAAR